MASTDATAIPVKNQAYRVTFPIFDADGDLVTGATGLDSEVSKDGGTFADCTNEATEIATSSGMYFLDLTSTEMNADTVAVIVKTSSSGAKTTPLVIYPQEGADLKVSVTHWNGTAVASPHTAGYPIVTVKDGTGTGEIDTTSGGVLVAALANNSITAASIASDAITAAKIADGAIDAATFAAGAIDASAIATDAIGSAEISAAAVTKIQSGLSTYAGGDTSGTTTLLSRLTSTRAGLLDNLDAAISTRLATAGYTSPPSAATIAAAVWDYLTSAATTVGSLGKLLVDNLNATISSRLASASYTAPLDAAGVRSAVGLASANLDTQLTTIDDFLDTEVAAIKAKTDNLPSDPADASDIAGAFSTVNTTLSTIAGYVDTEVAAIKAVTDQLADTLEDSGGGAYIFTSAALAQAPGGLTVQEIVDGVWDEPLADHLDSGTTGAGVNAAGSAGDPWATSLPGAYGAGTAGKIVGDNINATVGSRATQTSVDTIDDFLDTEVAAIKAKTDNLPTDPADQSAVEAAITAAASPLATASALSTVSGLVDDLETRLTATRAGYLDNLSAGAVATQTSVNTIDDFLDTEIADIKAKTDLIPASPAAVGSAMTLSNAGIDAIFDRTDGVETGYTLRQALRIMAAALAGELSGAATTTITIRNITDTKARITATVDADGNRSAVSLDAS